MRVAIYGSSCVQVVERIQFSTESAHLSADDDTTFDALKELFINYPELVLEIRGHADPWERNPKALARQRAVNVRAALVRRGIREAAMPLTTCDDKVLLEGRGLPGNRRVEFVIRGGLGDDVSSCEPPMPEVCRELAK